MSLDLDSLGQRSLLAQGEWRTQVRVPRDHRWVIFCKQIPWEDLMLKAAEILYEEQEISRFSGRKLNLRAHLGAYLLQTVHGWTDRWTEEMIRYYIPARFFCGFLESEGSLDHTSIEEFRTRFGKKGAKLITKEMLQVAKAFGFTTSEDCDMDTTVQEAGVTHPTEMKLMERLVKKAQSLSEKMKKACGKGVKGMQKLSQKFRKVSSHYRFFCKDLASKAKSLRQAQDIAHEVLLNLSRCLPGKKVFSSLKPRSQEDLFKLLDWGPRLLEQISHWLLTGQVAADKIVSLWKEMPKAICKGKVGKAVEFGRKWIVNAYDGGYVLVEAPENGKIADAHCVMESLALHTEVFEEMPKTYGADRGMYAQENLEICLSAGVQKIALQPKGQAPPLLGKKVFEKLKNRRAGIEARIAHLKTRGLGRSKMKSDCGDLISGYRSALSYNVMLLMRDLQALPTVAPG